MENKNIKISLICYGITTFIFLLIGIRGLYLSNGDEIAYCILNFYIIMPCIALIASFLLRIKNKFLAWLFPIYVGFLAIIIPYIVFHNFQSIVIYFTVIPSLIGIIIGSLIKSR